MSNSSVGVDDAIRRLAAAIARSQEAAAVAAATLVGVEANNSATAELAGHLAAANPHPQYSLLSHSHAAGDVTSGTFAAGRLGSGTADATTYLRGDGTWAVPPGASGGMANPMTSGGDLITGGTGGTPQRLAVGSSGQVLAVVSGAPAWAAPSAPAAATAYASTTQTITANNTWTGLTDLSVSVTAAAGQLLLCHCSVVVKAHSSSHWDYHYWRFRLNDTSNSEEWYERVDATVSTTRRWLRSFHTIFSVATSGTQTVIVQWLTPSDLDVQFFERRLTVVVCG